MNTCPPVTCMRRGLQSLALVCLFALASLAPGCKDALKTDTTNDPAYGNFSVIVGTYKTKVPLEILEIDKSDPGPGLYLSTDVVNYKKSAVLDVPAGTEMRIEHLIHEKVFGGTPNYATGSLVSGPYAGRSLRLDNDLFSPNPYIRPDRTENPPPDFTNKWAIAPDKLSK